MPIMNVTMPEGALAEDKRLLAQKLTDTVEATMQRPRGIIRVVIHEIPRDCYNVSGLPMSDRSETEEQMDLMINIAIVEGRTDEQKKVLTDNLIAAASSIPIFGSGPIRIIITDLPKANFTKTR